MKTNRFFSHFSALTALTVGLLWDTTLHAQTFKGQENLADLPKGFEAIIYPVTNRPSTIRVNFNNPTGGSVQVIIQDEKGRVMYNELETTARYRAYLELGLLPTGTYTIKLSKRHEEYVQMFTIEPPAIGRITLGNGEKPEAPVVRKLIVSKDPE